MARFEVLREVARLYVRQQREAVACCEGTSLTQCWILTELGRAGAMTLGDLARAIGFDKSWTSRAVDALVAERLVIKRIAGDDARKVRLTLSASGRERFRSVSESLDAHARRVLQRVPAGKRRAVQDALELLHDALRGELAGDEVACAN